MNNSKIKQTIPNSNTPTANSGNNFPKFLNKNYKSPSTEKLYTAIPKNLISNSKLNNKDLKKSPSLKIAPQFEQGNNLLYQLSKQTNQHKFF